MQGKELVFLVDASAIMFRSFYGLAPLRTSSGFPSQAVYGFFKTLKKLIAKFAPHRILLAWDSQQNVRLQQLASYKANRQVFPDELAVQRAKIIEIANTMGLAQLEIEGYEADDIIFAATKKFSEQQIIIVSSDKDLLQLVNERVTQFDPAKELLIDSAGVINIFGFAANKIAFYHALLGDATDNIPGAKGIGKKTAAELVAQFANLPQLYNNLDRLKPRTAALLTESREQVLLSWQLFQLLDCKLRLKLDDLKFDPENFGKANQLFKELEFTTLIESSQTQQASLFEIKQPQNSYAWLKFELIKTAEQLSEVLQKAQKSRQFAIDLETTGFNWSVDRIVGLSLAYEVEDGAEKVYYIPIAHQTADFVQLELQAVLLLFRPVLQDAQVNKIFQNAKFDLHFLRAVDADVPAEQVFDTMIAARLLRPEWQRVDLATLAQDYLKITIAEYKDLFADYSDFSAVPLAKAAPYAASDALCTLRLKKILAPQLQEQQLATLFTQVESPLIKVILAMEEAGICLDLAVLNRLAQEIAHEQKILEQKIRASFENLGVANAAAVNLLSPKQVEQVLFDELKLEPILKHKGGARSTGKEVLEELAKKHYLPGMILEYRRLAKLKNTYIDALPKQINPQTGRVHTTFTQARVATGRLSSLDPNLQNVPPQIREAFVPANGWQFLSADYSQIELRVLAHLSQDPALLESFRTGQDVHLQTAAQIFACSVDAVTMEQRQIGKKINFSVIYGLSAFNLARELNLSRSTAQNYIDAFFVQYQGVVQWMRTTVEQVKKVGYSTTLMGRKRFFPEINDRNALVSQAAQRAAINSVVQGTASEILKIAMVRLAAEMERLQLEAKILLQVHDELLFEVLPNELELLKSLVQKLMAQAVELQVPLEVSVKTGNNWGFVAKKH